MSDIKMEERIAIRESGRCLKKYGSTSSYNNSKRHQRYIRHQLSQTDTLQGLALKYAVTTEEIRRANRLWANDSIFLREYVLIPSSSGDDCGGGGLSPPNGHAPDNGDIDRDDSYSDFLVKIDCAIATTKSQVITAQGNSDFLDDDAMFWRRKSPSSRLRRESESSSCDGGSTGRPSEVVVMTQGRKVRHSLQRLERERDEIFEL